MFLLVSLGLVFQDAFAPFLADVIHQDNDDHHCPECSGILLVTAHADSFDHKKADATAGHKSDDRRGAHIDIPAQERIGQEGRDDLRDDRITDDLDPVGAGGSDGLDRAGVDVLDLLGE